MWARERQERKRQGQKIVSWAVAVIIAVLNVYLLYSTFTGVQTTLTRVLLQPRFVVFVYHRR